MQKFVLAVMLTLMAVYAAPAQNILVKGKPYTGKLTWKDFSGKADATSSFKATTTYKFQTRLNNLKFKKDTADLSGYEIDLELDGPKSWVKKGKETDYLLKHEQGHFDIGILLAREILREVNTPRFTKFNFQNGLNKIINTVSEKYRKMGVEYDKETDHSKNSTAQEKWNDLIEQALNESELKP